uniref:Uncharacterized protein n=1 Tax=Spongospora subterranea TaxID=70186 RepID=A0A0H5QG75_9EUKA|eukprot:CRZ00935.1 hypothetical protein [Spongospora subterranea]
MLYYHGRILQRLCCRTSTELSAESSREVHNKFLYQKRSLLSPFLLPLREDSSGGVVFTANINGGTVFVSSVVQPDLTRYMFNNLQPPDMEGTTFDGWVKFFPDRPRAQYVYKEFFGESPKPHQSITFRQFRISVDRFVQRRQRLTSWMETRDNLTDLIHRIVSGVYSLIMVFVTASLFGLNLTVVLSTLTSLMLSVAFAIGSTISKMTESIIYIFVYKVRNDLALTGVEFD